MSWQPSLSKLRTIILCFLIINSTAAAPTVPCAVDDSSKADVQADAVRPHLTHMLEEWKDAGWRLGVGLVLERATGRPLEVQRPWRLEKGTSRDVLPASAPRVVAQEFDASGV